MGAPQIIADLKQKNNNLADQLAAQIKEVTELRERLRKEVMHERECKAIAERQCKEAQGQFIDLKERLHASEMENQRLRGYVERVQEDDVVREDLVETGDPDGERQLVPKRRPTVFKRPSDFSNPGIGMLTDDEYGHRRDRPKLKHWISY